MRARIALPVAVLAAVSLLAATCGEPPATSMSRGGVTVRRIEPGEPAVHVGDAVLAAGDYLIEGDELQIVVGGLARTGEARGAILQAILRDLPNEESIVLLAPRVYLGAQWTPVIPNDMYVVERDGRPVLHVRGSARIGERELSVVRELTVADVPTVLSMTTRVATGEDRVRGVRFGMRIGWGGATPFVPGHGFIDDEAWHEATWLARSGAAVSTLAGFRTGPLRMRAIYERHGASAFLEYTEVVSARADVTPAEPLVSRSSLVLARGGISESVRRFGWTNGRPYPEVLARLPYAPAGTTVHVQTDEGLPVVQGRPDARDRVMVPLAPLVGAGRDARYRLFATAYGHAPSDIVAVERPGGQRVVRIPRGGQIRVTSRDGAGQSVPARIRIVGIDGTETPSLGPDFRAAGALDTVVEVEGDVEVPLRPGRYRVLVTRGPEWTLVEETVEVTETFRPQITARLEQVVDPGEWVGCDFHLHAEPSYDSQVTLQDRIASLRAEGVRFAVPTDHNVVTDYGPTLLGLEVRDIGTLPGVEVTTWDPSFGHFNAFPVPVDPALPANGAPEYQRLTPAALFASLRRFGPETLVQINHPRLEPAIGYFDLLGLDPTTGTAADGFSWDFDVIEVWNGFDLARPEKLERVFTDWLALLAAGRRFVATGNSDSHFVRFQWAGYPRTYVRVPGGDFRDGHAVLRALREGRAFVTNGPFLEATVDGKGPGETATVPAGGEARVRIVVRAPPWIPVDTVDVFAGGQLVATRPVAGPREPPPRPRPRPEPPLPVVRFDEEVPVPIAASTFLVVRATSLLPIREVFIRRVLPHAFTNPIWIETAAPVDAGPPDAAPPPP